MDEHWVTAPTGAAAFGIDTTAPPPGAARRGLRVNVGVVVIASVFAAAMVVTFSLVLDDVARSRGLATSDLATVRVLASTRGPVSSVLMRTVTDAGSPVAMCALAAVVCGWLAWRRDGMEPLVFGAAGVGGVAVLDTATKYTVARPRPPIALHAAAVDGYSFPSGHASFTAVVIPLCCALVTRLVVRGRWERVALWSGALVIVVVVGFSRVFLGAHYPSDVLAGWSLAGAWDVVLFLAMALIPIRPSRIAKSAPRHAARRRQHIG